jgi:zinc transporter 9
MSTPLFAVLTFLIVHAVDFKDIAEKTGVLLLFSGGTFLYVATMHIMPEVFDKHTQLTFTKMFILFVGMFTPLLISVDI